MFHAESGLLGIGVLKVGCGAVSDGKRRQGAGAAVVDAELGQVRCGNTIRRLLATQDFSLGKECLENSGRVNRWVPGKTGQRNKGCGYLAVAKSGCGCIDIENDGRKVDAETAPNHSFVVTKGVPGK